MSECLTNHRTIKQVVDWLFPARLFTSLSVRGGSRWKPRMIAVAALLWAAGGPLTLGERFEQARKIVKKVFRWQLDPGTSYQGFLKVLHKWHLVLLLAIVPEVRLRMQQELSGCWRIAGFVVFAGDGSRCEVARTESNEVSYSPHRKRCRQKKTKGRRKNKRVRRQGRLKKKERKKRQAAKSQSAEAIAKKVNSPQLWLTLLWHVGSGLPWAWRSGPSDSSERDHLSEMLGELPENSLITADAGFVGFEFWQRLLQAGHHFLIRVGGNVRLLKKLGHAREYDHSVSLWPDQAARKKQPPLVLRLIVVHNGKHPVYLVTNLAKSRLSDAQGATIYSKRWGIELFFRTFKQTFECRKLRSRAAQNCPLELDWSLLALWCVCLLGCRELQNNGHDSSRLSAAKAIKAFRQCLREYRVRPEAPTESLMWQLRRALLDDYDRHSSKTSRNYPRQKTRERTGPPIITRATQEQVRQAKELTDQSTKIRLTA
jgi:hypothetical protein